MLNKLVFAASLALLSLLDPAAAETLKFHAALAPASEVPPVMAPGSGTADATLDTTTHLLTYDVSFQGFATPVTMAHLHGPAAPSANAGVQVPLGKNPISPLHGTATLAADQQKQLLAGLWYANVHTTANPKGAARGQMVQTH